MKRFFSIALLLAVGLMFAACKKEKKEHKHHARKARVQKIVPKHDEGVLREAEDEVDMLIGKIEREF